MNTDYTNYAFADYLPALFAPDPGGTIARSDAQQYHVTPLQTPVQLSPATTWYQGEPYPGPAANQQLYVDYDSMRWWGREGQGQLIWSAQGEISGDLPPNTPQDMLQHIDTWQRFWGGFPSMARNRPVAFGDQVPVLNPSWVY